MSDIADFNAARRARVTDNQEWTVEDALEETLADLRSGEVQANRVLVLLWDDGDTDFSTAWRAANMRSSEMIALMEMVKATLLRDMGLT